MKLTACTDCIHMGTEEHKRRGKRRLFCTKYEKRCHIAVDECDLAMKYNADLGFYQATMYTTVDERRPGATPNNNKGD